MMAEEKPLEELKVEKVDEPAAVRHVSYKEFWPYYLKEHSKDKTRALHYVGSSLALIALGSAVVTKKPALLLAVPLAGYGPAWVAHFYVEHNQPATFKYPFWSLASDFRMYYLWLTGKLDAELAALDGPEATTPA